MVTEEIGALLGGVLIFLTLVNLAVMLYVAFSKLDEAEDHLANCELVRFNRKVWGGGAMGRMYRLSQICGALIAPQTIVEKSGGNLEEIRSLPASLRRWVKIPFITGAIFFAAMIVLWGYGKYTGWLE